MHLLGERFPDHGERFLGLRGPDDERRRQPEHVGAGGEDEEPAIPAGVHNRGHGSVERGAEKQAATPHLEHARQRGKARSELVATAPHIGQQIVVDRVDDGTCSSAHDRIPAGRYPATGSRRSALYRFGLQSNCCFCT